MKEIKCEQLQEQNKCLLDQLLQERAAFDASRQEAESRSFALLDQSVEQILRVTGEFFNGNRNQIFLETVFNSLRNQTPDTFRSSLQKTLQELQHKEMTVDVDEKDCKLVKLAAEVENL